MSRELECAIEFEKLGSPTVPPVATPAQNEALQSIIRMTYKPGSIAEGAGSPEALEWIADTGILIICPACVNASFMHCTLCEGFTWLGPRRARQLLQRFQPGAQPWR